MIATSDFDHRTICQAELDTLARSVGVRPCLQCYVACASVNWPCNRVDENSDQTLRVVHRIRDLCWDHRVCPEKLVDQMWWWAREQMQPATASLLLTPALEKAARYLSERPESWRSPGEADTMVRCRAESLADMIKSRLRDDTVQWDAAILSIATQGMDYARIAVLYRFIATRGPHEVANAILSHAAWFERINPNQEAAWREPLRPWLASVESSTSNGSEQNTGIRVQQADERGRQ